MTPRCLKLLVLLLPLIIARSMLPIGFMLSFDDATPRIVFCPGQITVPPTPVGSEGQQDAPLAHQGHEHHHGGDRSDANRAEHSACPFAFAAAAPLLVSTDLAPAPYVSEPIVGAPDSAIPVVASRAHPIRGPPALS